MTTLQWSFVEFAARFLRYSDREAVLGDLLESGESASQSVFSILGLAMRQHLLLWKNWRPWLAAFGLAFPCSFLLMGVSIAVSRGYQQFMNPAIVQATGMQFGEGFWLFLSNLVLLVAWAWSGGFVVGSISRKTLWVSSLLCFIPCVMCLSEFKVESLSRFCLVLFVIPAIWGVMRGLRITRLNLTSALIIALSVTALTIPAWSQPGTWLPNWALSWPAWYLVFSAWKKNHNSTTSLGANGIA